MKKTALGSLSLVSIILMGASKCETTRVETYQIYNTYNPAPPLPAELQLEELSNIKVIQQINSDLLVPQNNWRKITISWDLKSKDQQIVPSQGDGISWGTLTIGGNPSNYQLTDQKLTRHGWRNKIEFVFPATSYTTAADVPIQFDGSVYWQGTTLLMNFSITVPGNGSPVVP